MNKTCFVIMPFKKELDDLYKKLKSICKEMDIDCRRSDEIAIGSISKGIFEEIFRADVVIADLTFSNPNVYYELAISHCIGRKTILITQEEKIPFDIGQEYIIKYENTIKGATILEEQVKRLLKHIIDGGVIDNPAQMFLPKSREEEKLDKLSDQSKEILIALAESRKMEIEILAETAFLVGPESVKNVQKDLEKLNRLIDKIKNNK
jgi:hypothetical protein